MANPWIMAGGGALFVGGLAATIYLSVKMGDLAAGIESTKAQIRDVTTAIEELSLVVDNFRDLDDMYGKLNEFWGRMANDASDIKTMDDATAAQVGAGILVDKSSIEAAQDVTGKLTTACQTYLDVLNAQGIHIPTSVSSSISLAAYSPSALSHGQRLESLLDDARQALKRRDTDVYIRTMEHAAFTYASVQVEAAKAAVLDGLWFDVPALSSTAGIWLNGSRAFTASVDFPPSARSSVDPAIQAIVTLADSMDGALNEVRPFVQQSLTDVIGLGEIIQGWTTQYPTIPTSPEGIAAVKALQAKAIQSCQDAQTKALFANNKFADFTTEARDYQESLGRQVTTSQDLETQKRAAADEALHDLRPPWYVIAGGPIAVSAWLASESSSIRNQLDNDISNLDNAIAQAKQMEQSGVVFDGKAQTWIDMSQAVSKNLGGVYNILSDVSGQLLEDPILYADLMHAEWTQIVDDARVVLQMCGGGTKFALLATPSTDSDKALVLQAVSPAAALGGGISAQASSAKEVLSKLDTLLLSPYLKDIIGYWDESKSQRNTLFDVVTGLKTEYVQMIAMEYDAIQNISALALLQQYRAQDVADGKLPLDNFVKFTSQAVLGALSTAQRTSAKFGDAASQFEVLLGIINQNIDGIVSQISSVTSSIDTVNQQIRNQLIWVIADAIAICFAAAGMLVAFGVVGPVGAAVALAVQVGTVATATAVSIKLVLDSLSLSDLVKTVEALKALRNSLNSSVAELKTVQPLFSDVVKGVNVLTNTVIDMQNMLNGVLNNLDTLKNVTFTSDDANKVKDAWTQVRDDTQAWMDIVNSQGISPITLSIKVASI